MVMLYLHGIHTSKKRGYQWQKFRKYPEFANFPELSHVDRSNSSCRHRTVTLLCSGQRVLLEKSPLTHKNKAYSQVGSCEPYQDYIGLSRENTNSIPMSQHAVNAETAPIMNVGLCVAAFAAACSCASCDATHSAP